MVDQALEVVQEYESKLLKLEQAVLMKPQVKHVVRRKCHSPGFIGTDARALIRILPVHAIQGDLILHRRTLQPIKSLVYALRRYDVDRVAALADSTDSTHKVEGYMSHKSRIYLVRRLRYSARAHVDRSSQADVHDHMEQVLTSLDLFAGICSNLIDYTFNVRT